MDIRTLSELREHYGFATGRAKDKVLNKLEKHSIYFIECSPFLVMSTVDGSGKLDASPRGGEKGFVKILDNETLLIPDFKGNNRVDSLSNIIETSTIGLLFLIPGIDETLRVNGRASISTSEGLLNHFKSETKPVISCIKVQIEEVFLHCAKAFMRSKLWDNDRHLDSSQFPSMGQMLNDQLESTAPPESREAMIKRYSEDI